MGTEGPGAGRASLAPRPWTEGRGRGPADGESRAHRARPGLPASAPARLPCPHGGPGIAPRPSPPAHGGAVCVRQLAQLTMTSTAAPAGGSQARPHSRRQTTGVASGTRGQDSAWSPKLKPLRSRARCHSEPCSQGAPLSPMTPGGPPSPVTPGAPPSPVTPGPRPHTPVPPPAPAGHGRLPRARALHLLDELVHVRHGGFVVLPPELLAVQGHEVRPVRVDDLRGSTGPRQQRFWGAAGRRPEARLEGHEAPRPRRSRPPPGQGTPHDGWPLGEAPSRARSTAGWPAGQSSTC